MNWETVINLIDSSFIVVVAACWVVGYVLKSTPRFPDWLIPYAVGVFAITFTVWTEGFSPANVLQGVLCAAAAVYGDQLTKQVKKGVGKNADS
ncbi:hypothetical protein PC41400_21525 [Paenibacillus chitinolyticus]|uniref:Phage holin family protein n=1 Tax=Paenibacillus chitinolyticus TaxID=79263 RepID=A0A410X075_9BACL|nr:phage holin family protein [Paenibacillus chitinolyticus]MCY9593709.1 phage holin family protein [Paenibacillus chitinolyticus]MCY9599725.1 phage holin family protein [Paenibacillus chitinolyticus]QAV20105.1 hypothetical protein PC41400_21525 [Paenibacillus chitinolyticus]